MNTQRKTNRKKQRGKPQQGKSSRLKKAALLGGIFIVLSAVGITAVWRFYSYYQDPARFVERARELEQAGEYEAASDQYQRALRRARSPSMRVQIMNSMVQNIQEKPPAPVSEVREEALSLFHLNREIFRMAEDKEELARKLLNDTYTLASHLDSPSDWRELQETAQLVLRLDEGNPLARKYLNISRMHTRPREDRTERFYSELLNELDELLEDYELDRRKIVYYSSKALANRAADIDGEHLRQRRQEFFRRAVEQMDEYLRDHPDDLLMRVRSAQIATREIENALEPEKVSAVVEELEYLYQELSERQEETDDIVNSKFELSQAYFRIAQIAEFMALRMDRDIAAFAFDVEQLRQRSINLLNSLARLDDLNSLRAKRHLARIHRTMDNYQDALGYYEQLLDAEKVLFSPGVEAMIASQHQMFSRLERIDLWLTMYEDEARPEWDRQVENEIERLKETLGEEHPHLRMLEGRWAYVQGDYRGALRKIELAEEVLEETPQSVLYKGLSLARMGETGAAIERLSRFMRQPGGGIDQRWRALDTMAECLVRLRDFDQALQFRRRLLEQMPERKEAQLNLATTLMAQADFHNRPLSQESADEVRKLLEPLAQEGNMAAVAQLGRFFLRTGQNEAAAETLSPYQQEPELAGTINSLLYFAWLRQGEEDKAAALLEELAVKADDQTVAEYLSAAAAGEAEWRRQAGNLIQLALQPDDIQRKIDLYQFLRHVGEEDQAEETLRKLEETYSNDRRVLSLKFNLAFFEEDYQRAREIAEEAAALPEGERWSEKLKARVDLAEDDYSEAYFRLRRIDDEGRADSETLYLMAQAQIQQGSLSDAQASLERALQRRPEDFGAVRQLIDVAATRGLRRQAMSYMQHALRLAPNDSQLIQEFLHRLEQFEGGGEQALEMRLRLAQNQPDDWSNQLRIAELYLQQGRFEEAELQLQRLRRIRPQDADVVFLAARLRALTGEPGAGKQKLESFMQAQGDHLGVQAWIRYADFLINVGAGQDEVMEAIERGQKLEEPENPAATAYLADLRLRQGHPGEALSIYSDLHENTGAPRWLLSMAEAQLELGEVREARNRVETFLRNQGMSAQAGLLLARTQWANDEPEEALETLDEVSDKFPGFAQTYLWRAQLWLQNPHLAGSDDSVTDELRMALQAEPEYSQARRLLAMRLRQKGELEEAEEHFARLIEEQPWNNEHYDNLARIYLEREDYSQLRDHLERWEEMAAEPHSQAALLAVLWRARMAREQGEVEQALEYFTDISGKVPGDAGVLIEYMNFLLSLEQYEEAVQLYQQASEQVQRHPSMNLTYARASAALDKMDDAMMSFIEAFVVMEGQLNQQLQIMEEARRVVPRDNHQDLYSMAEPYDQHNLMDFFIAMDAFDRGDFQDSLTRLESLRRQYDADNPLYLRTLLLLSAVLGEDGRSDRAVEVLEEAREIEPNNPIVLNNLAYKMAKLGETPFQAVELAEQALENVARTEELAELRANILDTLGYTQYKADLLSYAVTSLERSLRLKQLPSAYLNLGKVYIQQQRLNEAQEALENARRRAAEEDELDLVDEAEALLNDIDEMMAAQAE